MSTARGALGHGPRARLAKSSRVVGPAAVAGRLFDLGSYPGLVLRTAAHAPAARVYGELRELNDPPQVFAWLDRYEGVAPGNAAVGEYYRTVLEVARLEQAGDGGRVQAWLYVYQGPLHGAREVPAGRWQY